MTLVRLCFVVDWVFVVRCIDFLLLDNLVPDGGVFGVCVISDLSGNLIVLMRLVLLWF